jgi:hypothetical protein
MDAETSAIFCRCYLFYVAAATISLMNVTAKTKKAVERQLFFYKKTAFLALFLYVKIYVILLSFLEKSCKHRALSVSTNYK